MMTNKNQQNRNNDAQVNRTQDQGQKRDTQQRDGETQRTGNRDHGQDRIYAPQRSQNDNDR